MSNFGNKMQKYIYIDTKIRGAVLQLISYFDDKVFDESFIVIFKLYRTNKRFLKLLKKHNIQVISFSTYRQLQNLKNSIVFYLFNAQSNCRIVAYREAKHIFVTHGESNKIPSVKPILRIYDYVSIGGLAGIDRLLENKIFTKCDVQNHKLIKMGNTFIGNLKFHYNKNSKALLYAPTWEGGIKEENYSSLSLELNSFKLLQKYAEENDIDTIILQIHPNIGHRDKRYLYYLYKGIEYLLQNRIKIFIKDVDSMLFNIIFFRYKKLFIDKDNIFDIKIAFCDVSAIEVQLLEKDIPYYIFFNNIQNSMPTKDILEKYYKNIGIYNFKINDFNNELYKQAKSYYLSYENMDLYNKDYKTKIEWLINTINE